MVSANPLAAIIGGALKAGESLGALKSGESSETTMPSSFSSGPTFWESLRGTVSELAKAGSEIAKLKSEEKLAKQEAELAKTRANLAASSVTPASLVPLPDIMGSSDPHLKEKLEVVASHLSKLGQKRSSGDLLTLGLMGLGAWFLVKQLRKRR